MLHIYLQEKQKQKHDATTPFDKKNNNLHETTCYLEVNKHSTK